MAKQDGVKAGWGDHASDPIGERANRRDRPRREKKSVVLILAHSANCYCKINSISDTFFFFVISKNVFLAE